MKQPTLHKDKVATLTLSAENIEATVFSGLEVYYNIENDMLELELCSNENINSKIKINIKIKNK
jgi:septum formation topological specificity factor MinE